MPDEVFVGISVCDAHQLVNAALRAQGWNDLITPKAHQSWNN